MKKVLNLFFISVISVSCAGMVQNRTFIDEMDKDTDGFFVPGQDFQVTPGDTGRAYRSRREIDSRTPMSSYDRADYLRKRSIRNELEEREAKLSPRELDEYRSREEYLPTRSEKIYYLSLPKRERDTYLSQRLPASVRHRDRRALNFLDRKSIRGRALYLGMDKSAVRRSWGRPTNVDIAGDPRNENERWSYYDAGQNKKVFFENGKVQGWETN